MISMLILEDDNQRIKHFNENFNKYNLTFTDSSKKCIKLLKKHKYDYLCLDHDLGGEQMVTSGENTGYEVVEFLCENKQYIPEKIFLHSLNPIGRKNMYNKLLDHEIYTVYISPKMWLP